MHNYISFNESIFVAYVYVVSGLTILSWITQICLIPGKHKFFLSQFSLVTCSCLSRGRTLRNFPPPLWHDVYGYCHCFCCAYVSVSRGAWLTTTTWYVAITIPPFFFCGVPWVADAQAVVKMYPLRLSLHWFPSCIQFWFSVLAFICCKEKFL